MGSTFAARSRSEAVAVGTPELIDMLPFRYPCSITAVPGGGGTLLIEYSTTPGAAAAPGSASWADWPSGATATRATDALLAPVTAIRATAAVAAGSVEVVG